MAYPNLFIFGIGGTGSRVLRSLAMLLAAGVPIKASKVIPIIIDTDSENGDLTRTKDILERYKAIRSQLGNVSEGFFSGDIARLFDLRSADSTESIREAFNMEFSDVSGKRFGEFLELDSIEHPDDRLLLQTLYSKRSLDDLLTKGFLGNPNVGSIVLNKIRESPEFRFFGNVFNEGDRIFIISSIFGGTGAAGFPLLVKNLRSGDQRLGRMAAIKEASIGAVTILPYFSLRETDESNVDSNNFITKTKAALSYYHENLKDVDAFYYIGDRQKKAYENHDGSEEQKNPAHLVELLSALSIIHFMEPTNSRRTSGESRQTRYFQYALKNDDTIDFSTVGSETKKIIMGPLTQFRMFSLLMSNHCKNAIRQPWAAQSGFGKDFFDGVFFKDVESFATGLHEQWLEQLENNERRFRPFDLEVGIENMKNLLTHKTLKRGSVLRLLQPLNFDDFDMALNAIYKGSQAENGTPKKFVELWWKGTKEIWNKRYVD